MDQAPTGPPQGLAGHSSANAGTDTNRFLLGVIVLGALLRLYHLTAPYVDLSAWRSLDYASMARNFYEMSYALWLPRVDWAGPDGLVESEFPILPWLVALVYPLTGVQAWLGRLLTLTCGLMGILYLFALVRRLLGERAALFSALVLVLNPLHLYFSRTFQPDVPMMAAVTAALYHLDRFLEGSRRHGVATAAAVAMGGCLKLSALFVGLPMLVLIVARRGWHGMRDWRLWAIGIAGLLPVALWYAHARHLFLAHGYTVGILSGGHDKLQTSTYLSMPWWWRVMLTERIWKWILTPAGIPLFLTGLVSLVRAWRYPSTSRWRRHGVLTVLAWLCTGCLFVLIVAEGNLDMPHYQLVAAVPGAVVTGVGVDRFVTWIAKKNWRPALGVAMVSAALLGGTCWTLQHAYDNKRAREVALGETLGRLMPTSGLLINPGAYTTHKGGYDYEPMVFYYAHRKGWVFTPEMFNPETLETYIEKGATHLATHHVGVLEDAQPFAAYLRTHYHVLQWNDQGVVVDLRTHLEAPSTSPASPVPPETVTPFTE